MMRAGSWLVQSGGLAAGVGNAAAGVAMRTAARAMLGLLRGSFGRETQAEATPSPDQAELVVPAISMTLAPVVAVASGKPAAAVALEPLYRNPDDSLVTSAGVSWSRMPAALAARLDTTLLDRGLAMARILQVQGRNDTVLIGIGAGSLRHQPLLARLWHLVEQPRSQRPKLVLLARGGVAAAPILAGLPLELREHVGIELTTGPGDEAEVELCLQAGPGCLQVAVELLSGAVPAVDLTARLMARVAATGVPVIVEGVASEGMMRRLRGFPALFARGPLFGDLRSIPTCH